MSNSYHDLRISVSKLVEPDKTSSNFEEDAPDLVKTSASCHLEGTHFISVISLFFNMSRRVHTSTFNHLSSMDFVE